MATTASRPSPTSTSGKIIAAFDRLGWDTPADLIAEAVGPVRQKCAELDGWRNRPPEIQYVRAIKWKFRELCPREPRYSMPIEGDST
jgi:hypothetical protein